MRQPVNRSRGIGRRAGRGVLVLCAVGILLAAADTYVIVLALPDMMLGVGLDVDQLQQAAPLVSMFLLGYIVVLPLVGRISDVVGRLPVLQGALLVFAAGSLITASAHGLGEAMTASGARMNNLGFSQAIFHGEITCPYDWGGVNHLLHEPSTVRMNTGSFRSPYVGVARLAEEVVVDEIAARFREDPYAFRHRMATSPRSRAVLDAVAKQGQWGRSLPRGFAQGIALHHQYNSYCAWLVEIDARNPRTPRITRGTCAVDVGHPINPSGLEQQMLGGLADGISFVLQAGIHFRNGLPLPSHDMRLMSGARRARPLPPIRRSSSWITKRCSVSRPWKPLGFMPSDCVPKTGPIPGC
jgi:hypothetical protein